jgi:hypothetical protein
MSFKKGQKVEVLKHGMLYTGKIINFGILNEFGIPKEYLIEYDIFVPNEQPLREYVPGQFIRAVAATTASSAAPNALPSTTASSAATNMPSYMAEKKIEPFPLNTRVEVWYNGKWEIGTIIRIQKDEKYVVDFVNAGYEANIPRNLIQLPRAAAAARAWPSHLAPKAMPTAEYAALAATPAWKDILKPMPAAAAAAAAMELVPEPMELSEPMEASKPVAVTVSLPMTYRSCSDFGFPLDYLQKCEVLRKKMWKKVRGGLHGTCGYTGPCIGILLLIFERNNIKDLETLTEFLRINSKIYGENLIDAYRRFMAVVNETTGNFLDLCDITPITQTRNGLMGLTNEQEANLLVPQNKVSLVTRSNLVKGPNVISFKTKGLGNSTFHHSMVYVVPEEDMCFILDSWMDNQTGICRIPSCRPFKFIPLRDALVTLNSIQCTPVIAGDIFEKYFMPPPSFVQKVKSQNSSSFYVYVLNQEYIKYVYTTCEYMMIGVLKTNFGGYIRKKKNVKTKRLYKKTNVKNKKPHVRKYIKSKKHRTRRQIRAK